jgi:hypothetical protein
MKDLSNLIKKLPQYDGFIYVKINNLDNNNINYKILNNFVYIKFIDLYSNFNIYDIQNFKKIIIKQTNINKLYKYRLENKKLSFFKYLKIINNHDDLFDNKVYISQELFLYFIMKYKPNEMYKYFQKENNIKENNILFEKKTISSSLINTNSTFDSINKERFSDISLISYSSINSDKYNNSYQTDSKNSFDSNISENIICYNNYEQYYLNNNQFNNEFNYDDGDINSLNDQYDICEKTSSLNDYKNSLNDSIYENISSLNDYDIIDNNLNQDDIIKLKLEKERTEQLKLEYKILKIQEDREKLNINLNYRLECQKLNNELVKLKLEKKKTRWF